jgi:hypothetical protein
MKALSVEITFPGDLEWAVEMESAVIRLYKTLYTNAQTGLPHPVFGSEECSQSIP